MDFEHLSKQERYDVLTEIANMYYIKGKTQAEIATVFDMNRFKVARLLQDARSEQIVEIKINYSNERNKSIEQELCDKFSLNKALVVNTQYVSQIDSLRMLGQVGANYLNKLLSPNSVIGITWGKTIQTAISQLSQVAHNPISAVQLTGYFPITNPVIGSRRLVRTVAAAYFGSSYFLNTPLYLNNPALKEELIKEPDICNTLCQAKKLDVTLTGIGGSSSLPLMNPIFHAYLTDSDRTSASSCAGSIYGYVLDKDGQIANIDLNRKLMAVPIEDIMNAEHRIGIVNGRHKTTVTSLVLRHKYINELITDNETAHALLEVK